MDQYPAGVIHLAFSGATADAEDTPLGTHSDVLFVKRSLLLYLFDSKVMIVPGFPL